MSRDDVFRFALCLLFLGCIAPQLAAAPPDAAKFAVTDAALADADFALQGEYLGYVAVAGGFEYAGLQVVALGDGKFEALYLKGGLPGAGWDRRTKTKLAGTCSEGAL